MSINQLIYSSSASKKMLKSDLYIILRQARKNNEFIGVTGLLIYADKYFFQVLEGQKEAVSQLFEKISNDKRHYDVQILGESNINICAFPNWRMAYATPSDRELATWAGLNSTTTVEATLNRLKSESGRVSEFLSNVLEKSSLIENINWAFRLMTSR